MSEHWTLFTSFAKSSLLGFGGGPSMVLLIQNEAVDVHGWLTHAEFLDAYAFGNALPSPIATKLAAFIGSHVAGWPGAAAALLGVFLPTTILVIAAASLYIRHRNNRAIKAIISGVRPVVVGLLAYVVWDFLAPVFGTTVQEWAANWYMLVATAVAVVLLVRKAVHPVHLILAGGVMGVAMAWVQG